MSDTANLFILAGIWSLVAVFIVRFLPNWPVRIVVFTLLVGVPFWELPYGYYNFHAICQAEARVQVFESIPPQRNICVGYPFEDMAKEVLKAGFESVEARGKAGNVRRFAGPNAADRREGEQDRVTADYCISSDLNIKIPWRILRHDHVVQRSSDGRVVARQSRFSWAGMWWQEAARPVLGHGGDCSEAMIHVFNTVRLGSKQSGR